MKRNIFGIILVCAVALIMLSTSVYALGYTGKGNKLSPGENDFYSDKKTSAGRYAAVNTTEGYPNPGQLIGPATLLWQCAHPGEGDWVIDDGRIGKNTRSSVYIFDDLYSEGTYYYFYIENDSSVNATYGMTYSVNSTY